MHALHKIGTPHAWALIVHEVLAGAVGIVTAQWQCPLQTRYKTDVYIINAMHVYPFSVLYIGIYVHSTHVYVTPNVHQTLAP